MRSIFAQKSKAKPEFTPFEFNMAMRGRLKLEFGTGIFKRQIFVTEAQEQKMHASKGKRPLTEKIVFEVLSERGKK